MPTKYENRLLPYLEDQLDPAAAAEMADRLAADPSLTAEAERLQRTLNSLRQTAARSPSADATDHWSAIRARLVLAPKPRLASGWVWAMSGTALTAVVAAAAFVLWLHPHSLHQAARVSPPPILTPAATIPAPPIPARTAPAPAPVAAVTPAAPKAVVKIQKAAVPKLVMSAHYDPLRTVPKLPYFQADPFTPPLAKPPIRLVFRPRPRGLFRRLKPAAVQRPIAPALSAGKLPVVHHSAAPPVMIPSPDMAPNNAPAANAPDLIPPAPPTVAVPKNQ